MQFGLFFLMGSPTVEASGDVYERVLKHIRLADELGYDSVWIAEHHFSNYGYVPNPLMMAIRVAAETQRVRIGTAVLVLPFWHPLRLAEEIAMADQLTGGRLEVGVARGYQAYEFSRFGLNFEDARPRTEEILEILLKALTEDGFSYEGKYHTIPETTIFPKSLQRPRPPIWLAAQTEESFDASARLGLKTFTSGSARPIEVVRRNWNWFLEARRRHGVDTPIEFAVQQQLCVAPTDDVAREWMGEFRYSYRQVQNLRQGQERVERGISYELPIEGEPSLDNLFETHTLSGSPESVRRKVQAYVDAVGLTLLNCTFAMGKMPPEVVERSIRLFAEEVMPHFR